MKKILLILGIVLLLLPVVTAQSFDPGKYAGIKTGDDCTDTFFNWYECGDYNTLCECKNYGTWLVTNRKWDCRPCPSGQVCGNYGGIYREGCAGCNDDGDCPNGYTCNEPNCEITNNEPAQGNICIKGSKDTCASNNQKCTCVSAGAAYNWNCQDCGDGTICQTGECVSSQSVVPEPTAVKDVSLDVSYNVKGTTAKVKVVLVCTGGCGDISGTLSYGEQTLSVRSTTLDISIPIPDFGETDKKITFKYSGDSTHKKAQASITITEKTEKCSGNLKIDLTKNTCKCGSYSGFYDKGYCCNGHYEGSTTSPGDCRSGIGNLKKCPTNGNPLIEDCMCDGKQAIYEEGSEKYCCTHGGDLVTNIDQCPAGQCNTDCSAENSLKDGKTCICPKHCDKSGELTEKSTDKTCGHYNPKKMCDGSGGICMKETRCISKMSDASANYAFQRNDELDATCTRGDICCPQIKDDNPGELFYCDTTCKDPDGCICPKNCKIYENGEMINGPETVDPGYTCMNKYNKEAGAKQNCIKEKRDNFCPAGCFWFNDLDCGVDKNLGNVLWDVVIPKKWRQAYDETWGKFWRDLGAQFDIMTWGESVCNPTSGNYEIKGEPATFIDDGSMVGWLGAKKDLYNQTDYVYTVNWYLSSLPEDNHYNIVLRGDSEYIYPENSSIEIFAGTTHAGDNRSIVIIGGIPYTQACILFDKKIDHKPLMVTKKIKEVCRSI